MDQLLYNYIPNTNQLDHIYDTVSGVSNANDIAAQGSGNYKYDSIGELTGDAASNITNITWTVYGMVASITKSSDTVIRYTYDPAGNRISKTVTHGGQSTVTWISMAAAALASGSDRSMPLTSTRRCIAPFPCQEIALPLREATSSLN
jgi:YD repeat-containing protein